MKKGPLADAQLKVFIIIQLHEVSINGGHFKYINHLSHSQVCL